jgi:hypothetical protein
MPERRQLLEAAKRWAGGCLENPQRAGSLRLQRCASSSWDNRIIGSAMMV